MDADVAPTETEYAPALQLMHADADVAPTETEYVPALQLMHVDSDVAPSETEYVPALQLKHSEAPTPAYFPISQSTHTVTWISAGTPVRNVSRHVRDIIYICVSLTHLTFAFITCQWNI